MIKIDKFVPVDIAIENIEIKERSIFRLLGYSENLKEDFVSSTINSCKQRVFPLFSLSGGYIIKKITALHAKEGILEISDLELNTNKIISLQLKKASHIALFVGTIGDKIEKLSDLLFKNGDPFEGYITNLIGSEATESVAHFIHETIRNQMQDSGYSITNRFSPGYCDWNVAEQFKLFGFFPDNACNVLLTDSALMIPVKSISGIIGIGKDVNFKPYPCQKCTRENCIYNNTKSDRL
jgi:hypothetical protein